MNEKMNDCKVRKKCVDDLQLGELGASWDENEIYVAIAIYPDGQFSGDFWNVYALYGSEGFEPFWPHMGTFVKVIETNEIDSIANVR